MKRRELLLYLCLTLVLLSSAHLFWLQADVVVMKWDDRAQIGTSHAVAGGEYRQLLAPYSPHWQPLFRLIRLYFDLDFPERHGGFHAVVVLAHVVSTGLVFLLSRRYFSSPWSALAAAAVFGWCTMGLEAFVWKAASHYVLAWPFALGAMYCLARWHTGAGWWLAGSFGLQLAMICIFTGAVAASPGMALGYLLLERPRRRVAGALAACGGAALIGAACWILFVPSVPESDDYHFGDLRTPAAAIWLLRATLERCWTYGALGLRLGEKALLLGFVVPGAIVFALARRQVNLRWPLAAGVLTALPLAVITLAGRFQMEQHFRYGYQSFLFWAVLAGAAVDGLLVLATLPLVRRIVTAGLLGVALLYYRAQYLASAVERNLVRHDEVNRLEFWRGWAAFFRDAGERNRLSGSVVPLPPLPAPDAHLSSRSDLHTVFLVTNPSGREGISLVAGEGTPEQRARFWQEVATSRARSEAFRAVTLPPRPP